MTDIDYSRCCSKCGKENLGHGNICEECFEKEREEHLKMREHEESN